MLDRGSVSDPWRTAPWTVKSYAALIVTAYAFGFISLEHDAGTITRLAPTFWLNMFVSVLLIVGLIRRSRGAWIIGVVRELWWWLTSLVWLLMEPKNELLISTIFLVIGSALLPLLIHPSTRSWIRRASEPTGERTGKLATPT